MPLYSLDGVRPELPPSGNCYVAPDAALIGKVRLAEESSVWFTAVLRGDNEWITIGAGSNVQDGCVLHTDPGFPLSVGGGCTIGHRVVLHGCTIGDNSLIGMGAVLLNGARIGRDSIVGAGALVTEGKEFPDRALVVGSPARSIRTLDDKTVDFLRFAAQVYRDRASRYAQCLRQID
jgi:carbonic anhydrase/acetyltransferase-like protein (isoleucine patch superfamily)